MAKLSLAKLERHGYTAADRLRQEGLDAEREKIPNCARRVPLAEIGGSATDWSFNIRRYNGKAAEKVSVTIENEFANVVKLGFLKSGLMTDLLTGRVRVLEGIAVTE